MTRIEWTERTWNPTKGCSRVSPGCDNCYAMFQARRQDRPGGVYEGLTRSGKRGVDWSGRVRLDRKALFAPLRRKKPTLWFVNSMSDLFHESLRFEEIAAVFGVMAACPQHTFQVLTKRDPRPWFKWVSEQGRMLPGLVGADAPRTGAEPAVCAMLTELTMHPTFVTACHAQWPLLNLWLGVSVESRDFLHRIDWLRQTPAGTHFVSFEPLLRDLGDISTYLKPTLVTNDGRRLQHPHPEITSVGGVWEWGLDWGIAGGESGRGARECHLEWFDPLVRQFRDYRVPLFMKQLGARPVCVDDMLDARARDAADDEECDPADVAVAAAAAVKPIKLRNRKGGDILEWPEELRVRQFPPRVFQTPRIDQ